MHEAGLMNDLMRRITDIAAREQASHVTAVAIWLGALSHFSAEHFTEHFARASRGTMAEGARLDLVLSEDLADANAQHVLLRSVEVDA